MTTTATAVFVVLACATVVAQPAKQPAAKKADVAQLAAALAGADVEAAAKAADALGDAGTPAAHVALLDALAFGLPRTVAVPVIDALARHPAPPDVTALVRYAGHHDPAVRSAVFGALASYPDPVAHAAIATGLHDGMGIVRAAAATAAGRGHVREAIEPMFQLLARSEEPASRALAAMADPDLARKIADQLGAVPDPILAQCLGLILKRADFGPDTARVEIVRSIAKITDNAAVTVLTDYIDSTPKNPVRPSRHEAEVVVETRLGGGK